MFSASRLQKIDRCRTEQRLQSTAKEVLFLGIKEIMIEDLDEDTTEAGSALVNRPQSIPEATRRLPEA